jgi:hypothetical protein
MARDSRVKGDPHVYRVIDGRLYFNLNARVHAKWERGARSQIRSADAHWRAARASTPND